MRGNESAMAEAELRMELDPSIDEGFISSRERFAEWLDEHGVSGSDAEELSVVVSELMANAVAASADDDPIRLWARRAGARVWVEVTNRARRSFGFPPMPATPPDPLGPSGRGLLIVDAFTDRVDAETLDGETRVSAVKTLRESS